MKKLLMLLSGVAITSAAYASPVLNPAAPALNTDGVFYCCPNDCWALRVGFRGDYVFNRKFENNTRGINRYSLYSNEGALTLNFWDRVDLYGFVGATSQNFNSIYRDAGAVDHELDADFTTQTIWGVGLKVVIWEWDWTCHCGRSFLSADVNYESVSSATPKRFLDDMTPTLAGSSLPSVNYKETQVSLAWGHRVKNLVPYIAAKWSNARANLANTTIALADESTIRTRGLKSAQHWGWALGVSLVDVARMTISAEARFIDETAMTVTGSFRF